MFRALYRASGVCMLVMHGSLSLPPCCRATTSFMFMYSPVSLWRDLRSGDGVPFPGRFRVRALGACPASPAHLLHTVRGCPHPGGTLGVQQTWVRHYIWTRGLPVCAIYVRALFLLVWPCGHPRCAGLHQGVVPCSAWLRGIRMLSRLCSYLCSCFDVAPGMAAPVCQGPWEKRTVVVVRGRGALRMTSSPV